MKRKVKRFNGESGSVVNDEPLSAEDKELLNITLEEMRRDVGKSSQDEDGGTTAEFKRTPKLGGERSETANAPTSIPKKTSFNSAFAAARAKALRGGPKTFEWEGKTYGTALKGETSPKKSASKSEEISKEDSVAPVESVKSVPKPAKLPRTTAEIRAGKPAAEEKPSKVTKLSFLTPEKLESARKSYYSGFESKPVRSTADIRAGRGMKKGGKVSSASSRADGCAQRGKTRGKLF